MRCQVLLLLRWLLPALFLLMKLHHLSHWSHSFLHGSSSIRSRMAAVTVSRSSQWGQLLPT
jgi:hypothetical protein